MNKFWKFFGFGGMFSVFFLGFFRVFFFFFFFFFFFLFSSIRARPVLVKKYYSFSLLGKQMDIFQGKLYIVRKVSSTQTVSA